MEDKIFTLLEKMYADLNSKIDCVNTDMQEIKENMATKQEMRQGFDKINQTIVRLEDKMDANHKALFDGYQQSIEGINELRIQVDKLTDQVEHQEIKLQLIQRSK